jgi:RNA polymerase sigma-70 factor, ECF subfamily
VALSSDQLDSELVARSRAEPALFAEIFDRHHDEVYRYLRGRVGATLAADLAADTFVTAFARRAAYRPERTDVRPWLYSIAHNLLRNHLRREKRQLAAYARHAAEPAADPGALAAFAMADERADSAAARAPLAQILARMRPGDRDVLLLIAWADLSYAEVADALNIPVGTVRSRLNRVRRQLRPLAENESFDTVLGERHG